MSYDFEIAMQNGLAAHRQGNYQAALEYRLDAFAATPPGPLDRGRVARDIAASFDRLDHDPGDQGGLDNQVLAEAYAEYAFREHAGFVPRLNLIYDKEQQVDQLVLNGCREFTVSAMYMAVLEARARRGNTAVDYISRAANVSWSLHERFGTYHQYDVNLMPRVAGIKGAFPERYHENGRASIRTAKKLAKLSETNELLGFNESLTPKEVKDAQRKARIRALGAFIIVKLAQLPTRELTKPISRRILNKIVL